MEDNNFWQTVTEKTLVEVLGPPRHEDTKVWQWPGKETARGEAGRSFIYNRVGGYEGRWQDWSTRTGGQSPFTFLEYWHGWDKKESIAFLHERGILEKDERYKGSGRTFTKKQREEWEAQKAERDKAWAKQREERERAAQKERENGIKYAKQLWAESDEIMDDDRHPVRRWLWNFNLLHEYCTPPPCLRWHRKRGWIVAGFCEVGQWVNQYPIYPDVMGVSLIAITREGERRNAWGEGTMDKKSHGYLSGGMVCMGSPNTDRVVVVEGLKDMLAVYQHYAKFTPAAPCSILSPITTVSTVARRPGVVDYMRGRHIELWGDTDRQTENTGVGGVGQERARDAYRALKEEKIESVRIKMSDREVDDPGAWGLRQPMPIIDRASFEECSSRFISEGLAQFDADRRAVHHLSVEDGYG